MQVQETIAAIRQNIGRVVVGKEFAVNLILTALLCRGHVLLEDVPGIGKTTLVTALARSLGCTFRRIQFTPDIMPSDITGYSVPSAPGGDMAFRPGAIMSQIVLADEINRTSPKTQSSLLEAMQENQVTVDGRSYPLPQPFMVLATQNPVEYVGTYPLPEAQLDRFLMRIALGYPSLTQEMAILERFNGHSPLVDLEPVADVPTVLHLQDEVDRIRCSEPLREYIALLSAATRTHADVTLGISPRGALALMASAKAWALLENRDYATPDDVQRMIHPVFSHRILLRPEARLKKRTARDVIQSVVSSVTVPRAI
ncbi:MAG: MoxR family ATPase [Clostridia bacterium]|nr:MoxR family ATPase [Clostridia bacterium]